MMFQLNTRREHSEHNTIMATLYVSLTLVLTITVRLLAITNTVTVTVTLTLSTHPRLTFTLADSLTTTYTGRWSLTKVVVLSNVAVVVTQSLTVCRRCNDDSGSLMATRSWFACPRSRGATTRPPQRYQHRRVKHPKACGRPPRLGDLVNTLS